MNRSRKAMNAVGRTRRLFEDNTRSPQKEQLMEVILLYGGLRTLEPMVEAATKLTEGGYSKSRIDKKDGEDLYGGRWFAHMNDKKEQWRKAKQ